MTQYSLLKQHPHLLLRYSETFYREAQNPVVVVLRGCVEQSYNVCIHGRDMGAAYITRLHVCDPVAHLNSELHTPTHDYKTEGYEISGHYDMTWDEAIEDFYRRCIRESTGTDLRPEKQPTYCPFLARETRDALYEEDKYAAKLLPPR